MLVWSPFWERSSIQKNVVGLQPVALECRVLSKPAELCDPYINITTVSYVMLFENLAVDAIPTTPLQAKYTKAPVQRCGFYPLLRSL